MIEEEKRQFFATQTKPLHTARIGGKRVALANFPEDEKKRIMKRLAEKDEVQRQGQSGILPGLKIDGKQVTRDNIHEFEIKPKKTEIPKIEIKIEPVIPKVVEPETKVTKIKKTRESSDEKRKALSAGKRISKTGKKYYEHRKNRSD